nr:unnamed protein product [Callosobruchus chinensis]
MVSREG